MDDLSNKIRVIVYRCKQCEFETLIKSRLTEHIADIHRKTYKYPKIIYFARKQIKVKL